MKIDRRLLIKGLGAAAAGSLLPQGLMPLQAAEAEKPVLVIIQMRGGFNSIFNSAGIYANLGHFGVNNNNVKAIGKNKDLVMDKMFHDGLPKIALDNIATIGVNHGQANHAAARDVAYEFKSRNAALMIANEIGGKGVAPAINVGNGKFFQPYGVENGISFQPVVDLDAANELLGVKKATGPSREVMHQAMLATRAMDLEGYKANADSLKHQKNGLDSAIASLSKVIPVKKDELPDLKAAYDLNDAINSVTDKDFTAQLLAAELMIRGGTNVAVISQTAKGKIWDTHNDLKAERERAQMKDMLPALNLFLTNMLALEGHNVVVLITGDFCRIPTRADHGDFTTSTVIGKNVVTGTTGVMNNELDLKHKMAYPAQWGYIAEALNLSALAKTFGGNPHGLIKG